MLESERCCEFLVVRLLDGHFLCIFPFGRRPTRNLEDEYSIFHLSDDVFQLKLDVTLRQMGHARTTTHLGVKRHHHCPKKVAILALLDRVNGWRQ